MDTLNMLSTMRFYCQPILPLVYDESMSYYETLCKVVGQLNTTGETVNKLNEGLTNEIADRQAADAALDERLKTIESTNAKIHFMAFAGTPPYDAKPIYAMPTRSELRQWVTDGDMIVTLMQTTDEGRNIVYAASCAYNAPNWENASFDDFNIIVPISTAYDSEGDCAVRQKIAKITIPPASAASLDEKWGLQIIEINTPHTSAEGMVNFTATVVGETVTASITPAEFIKLFDAASATAKLCVGVNARLNYNALELSSSVATVYDNSSAKREVRITFVQDPHAGRRDYVPSEIFDIVNIVGDKDANTWKIETFGTELFDFQRYEGFQFTRKAGNVIEAAEDCDPASVAQYYNDLHGKEYQNLPVHLIDEVDNADYWNGTFNMYGDNHMTFTFVMPNYATASDKMLVRIIELSADANDSAWKYGVKELDPITVTSTKVTSLGYDASEGATKWTVIFDESFDSILANLAANKPMKFNITLPDSTTGLSVSFNTGYLSALNDSLYSFTGTIASSPVVLNINKLGAATVCLYADYLPEPNPDDSDDGKTLVVNKHKWELKVPTGGGPSDAVLYTPQTLTDAQKKQARENVDAASDFVINASQSSGGGIALDKTAIQIREAINAGKTPIMRSPGNYMQLLFADGTDFIFGMVGPTGSDAVLTTITVSEDGAQFNSRRLLATGTHGELPQQTMAFAPTADMQIATKKYVDDAVSRAPITIKLGDNNAATSAAAVDEIKAALEAGNAPVLESVAGDIICFVLNWRPISSSRFTIQYGTFDFNTDGKAAFDIYTVTVSAAGITYVINTFVSA